MRAVFVALVLATTAVKIRASHVPGLDMRTAIINIVAPHGWSLRPTPTDLRHPLLDPLTFQAPGCDGTVQIYSVAANFETAPLLDLVISPQYRRTVAYHDKTWPTIDRLAIRIEWLKHRSMQVLGLSRDVSRPPALVIAEPAGCRVVETIDWSQAWVDPE